MRKKNFKTNRSKLIEKYTYGGGEVWGVNMTKH